MSKRKPEDLKKGKKKREKNRNWTKDEVSFPVHFTYNLS